MQAVLSGAGAWEKPLPLQKDILYRLRFVRNDAHHEAAFFASAKALS
jgi:hypothetical protein